MSRRSHQLEQDGDALRIALVADAHYADKPPAIGRSYRESLTKLAAVADAVAPLKADLAVSLGDLIDSTGPEDADRLRRINDVFQRLSPRRLYVMGNHCLERLSKTTYLSIVGQQRSYFSLDVKGVHLIVLDACVGCDGRAYGDGPYDWHDSDIPAGQRDWLAADLAETALPTVVFVHQRLDSPADAHYGVASAAAVREILQASGRVKLVVQGHHHVGDAQTIDRILYLTLPALVEGAPELGGHSVLHINRRGDFFIRGFGRHYSHESAEISIEPAVTT